MVLAYKNIEDYTDNAADWVQDILSSYDINICKGSYNVEERQITYPTDPNIYHYISTKAFYYHINQKNRNTLPRIQKYTERGFHFAGYYDSRHNMVQLMDSNSVHKLSTFDGPDQYFLDND
jgi:hypothetical protein